MAAWLLACFFLLSQLAVLACAWRTSGSLPLEEGGFVWYAGKFCYDASGASAAGALEVQVDHLADAPTTDVNDALAGIYFATYDDEEHHWQTVRNIWDSASCHDLLRYASFHHRLEPEGETAKFRIAVFEKLRPRWWYFAFISCGKGALPKPATYSMHAKNILRGYQAEFSMDDQGALELHLIAAILFSAVGVTLCYAAIRRFGSGALRSRPLLSLLLLSCGSSATGALCLLMHNVAYMRSGEGLEFLAVMGDILLCFARAKLASLQLFAAKGWGLFLSPKESRSRRLMTFLLLGIVATTVLVEIHGRYFSDSDRSTRLYFYASWSGMLILICNALLSMVALWSMMVACRTEASRDVRMVNVAITAVSLVYFLALPVTCVLANVLEPWVRRKVVARMETCVRLAATVLLAAWLKPSRMDAMIDARMAVPEVREQAVELADPISCHIQRPSPAPHASPTPALATSSSQPPAPQTQIAPQLTAETQAAAISKATVAATAGTGTCSQAGHGDFGVGGAAPLLGEGALS